MLTDRQRVELIVIPAMFLDVIENGTPDPAHSSVESVRKVLQAAMLEPVSDLAEPARSKVIRRSRRIYDAVMSRYKVPGTHVAAFGLLAFHWLKAVLDSGYIRQHAGPTQDAIERVLPALDAFAQTSGLANASARIRAKRLLLNFQVRGLFLGVPVDE